MDQNPLVRQPPTPEPSPCSVEVVGLLSLPAHSIEKVEKAPLCLPKTPSAQNSPAAEDRTTLAKRYDTRSADTAEDDEDEDDLGEVMPLRRCISMPVTFHAHGSQYRRRRDDPFPDIRLRRMEILSPLSLVKKVYANSPLMVDLGVLENRPNVDRSLESDVCESTKRMQRTRGIIGRTQPPPASFLPAIP